MVRIAAAAEGHQLMEEIPRVWAQGPTSPWIPASPPPREKLPKPPRARKSSSGWLHARRRRLAKPMHVYRARKGKTNFRQFLDAAHSGQNAFLTRKPRAASASQTCPGLLDAAPLGLKFSSPLTPSP
jgi:hypothetical protein